MSIEYSYNCQYLELFKYFIVNISMIELFDALPALFLSSIHIKEDNIFYCLVVFMTRTYNG